MQVRLVATGVFAALVASCGAPSQPANKAPPATLRPAAPRFEGLVVAGTPADAKASGFTECTTEGNGYYGFTCAKPGATIMGVMPLRASVRLSYPTDYPFDAERTPENTSYDSVGYAFAPPTDYKAAGCNFNAENPYACYEDQSQPLPALVRALTEAGWIGLRGKRGGASYVKPGQLFLISFPNRDHYEKVRGRNVLVSEVSVTQITAEEVAEIASAIQSERAASNAKADSNASFIENMKAN